jgi:hypothetical protein
MLSVDGWTQCDEGRPSCGRCLRTSRSCQYRDPVDLILHNQTTHTSERAQKLWQSRSVKTIDSRDGDAGAISGMSSPGFPITPETIYDLALQRFIFDYVFQANFHLGRLGHLEFLPQILTAVNQLPFLSAAIESAVFANFAKRYNSPVAMKAAIGEYGKAVSLTNDALRSPSMVEKDEILLACFLLGICEVLKTSKRWCNTNSCV